MKKMSFEGHGGEYFKIWIVNILLVLVTLGIYYPWAKVRTQRYFYANTVLDGRSFDYHATGKQLLVGYLIAMALFILYIVIQQIAPIIGGLLSLGLLVAIPWIIWRSLMFNMRMTSFSNVRFGFDGTLGQAYVNYLLLPILLFVTFYGAIIGLFVSIRMDAGLMVGFVVFILLLALSLFLAAFIAKKNTLYSIGGYRFGQGQFASTVETSGFLKIYLKTVFVGGLILISAVAILAAITYYTIGFEMLKGLLSGVGVLLAEGEDNSQKEALLGIIFLVVYVSLIIITLIITAFMVTRQRAYVLSNTTLDKDIGFNSTLKARPFAWVLITNLFITIFTLGLALPWCAVRVSRLITENTQVYAEDNAFNQYISQKENEQSPLGEQIGDAFDVDVGVAF
jgi:uncharacterized membrane protein YjgN (DUF898 family)